MKFKVRKTWRGMLGTHYVIIDSDGRSHHIMESGDWFWCPGLSEDQKEAVRFGLKVYRKSQHASPINACILSDGLTIGRSSACGCVCNNEFVSRKHGDLSFSDGKWYFCDHSTNGSVIGAWYIKNDIYQLKKEQTVISLGGAFMLLAVV